MVQVSERVRMGEHTNEHGYKGMKGESGEVGQLFWSVNDPSPIFEVEVPPRRDRVPVEKALPLKQRTESENLQPPPLQLIRHQVIRGEGDDDWFPPVAG